MLKYEIIDNHAEEWVVFVHGLGGSTETWKKQIDSFSARYNLLLLDLPGHGRNAEHTIHKVDTQKLHAGIRIIEKCGHVCSIENWRAFNRLALEYLSAYKSDAKCRQPAGCTR